MKNSLFISYCRREAPFVDSLLGKLENQGFKVWLDYHTLIPGKPWEEQIYQGIVKANVFLLIVSKESIASKNVMWEWQQAIKLKKRIILVIFEAVELRPLLEAIKSDEAIESDPELKSLEWLSSIKSLEDLLKLLEWVDLRNSFRRGIRQLTVQIASPVQQNNTPPQEGFKAPTVVWIAFWMSLVISLISLPGFWTLYIPRYLLPLPYRILKRDFNFFKVQMALIALPFVAFFTGVVMTPDSRIIPNLVESYLASFYFSSFILVPTFILLLRSPGMQRWGKPIASPPKFANPYNPDEVPTAVRFLIDSAPQDKKYADAVIKKLEKYQHTHVTDPQSAEVIVLLLSTFKNRTDFKIGEKVIYPVILQDIKNIKDLDSEILQFQWIDFRRGLKNLDKLAQLLPKPEKLLKALGIVPVGYQTVLPPIVAVFVYYLTLLAIFTIAGWSAFFFYTMSSLTFSEIGSILLLLGVFEGTILLTIQSLVNRRGLVASFRRLLLSVLTLGAMTIVQLFTGVVQSDSTNAGEYSIAAGAGVMGVAFFYFVGLVIVGLLSVLYWKDLQRWFPAKVRVKAR